MRTSMNIPKDLLVSAMELAQIKGQTQVVILALTEFIMRRNQQKILNLEGEMEKKYNYKKLREKR